MTDKMCPALVASSVLGLAGACMEEQCGKWVENDGGDGCCADVATARLLADILAKLRSLALYVKEMLDQQTEANR